MTAREEKLRMLIVIIMGIIAMAIVAMITAQIIIARGIEL